MDKQTQQAIEKIQRLQPHALGYILKNGFTFDVVGPLADDASELDRWKVLAFSLYTDLCEAESVARAILDNLEEAEAEAIASVEKLATAQASEWKVGFDAGWHKGWFTALDAVDAVLATQPDKDDPTLAVLDEIDRRVREEDASLDFILWDMRQKAVEKKEAQS